MEASRVPLFLPPAVCVLWKCVCQRIKRTSDLEKCDFSRNRRIVRENDLKVEAITEPSV